jgi:hypothetical protein
MFNLSTHGTHLPNRSVNSRPSVGHPPLLNRYNASPSHIESP